jgi:tetratricopeptide (TPR) repeat protein
MSTVSTFIGYIILGLSVLFTLGWGFHLRAKAKNDQATEKPLELQGLLFTISVVFIPLFDLSPFNLLWMLPLSFFLGITSMSTPLRFLWIFSSIYFFLWYIGIANQGRKYYLNGDYGNAIEYFKSQISKKPSSESYFSLGLAYGKNGQVEEEIAAYEESIRLGTKNPAVHFNLGLSYDDTGKKREAVKAFKEALGLSPEYLKAHYQISKICFELGEDKDARKHYEIVKKADVTAAQKLSSIIQKV